MIKRYIIVGLMLVMWGAILITLFATWVLLYLPFTLLLAFIFCSAALFIAVGLVAKEKERKPKTKRVML